MTIPNLHSAIFSPLPPGAPSLILLPNQGATPEDDAPAVLAGGAMALQAPLVPSIFRLGCDPVQEEGLSARHPSLTLTKALAVASEEVVSEFRKLFPDLQVELQHAASIGDVRRTPGGPVVGVLDYGPSSLMMAALGQREHPDASFVVVPYVPRALFSEKGRLFARVGLSLRWEGPERLVVQSGRFSSPLELENEEQLRIELESAAGKDGAPSMNAASVRALCSDKLACHAFLERHGIQSPSYRTLGEGWSGDDPEFLRRVSPWIDERGVQEIVVKPNNRKRSEGVRLLASSELLEAREHAAMLLGWRSVPLIEERIRSFPLVIDGQQMDWKIRVVIPPGDLSDWRAEETSVVNYRILDDQPVSRAAGASIMELETAMERMGFHPDNRAQLLASLTELGRRVRDAMMQELAGGGNPSAEPRFLGLDVIVDSDLSLWLIEINAGLVGGIDALAELRAGERRFLAVRPLMQAAYDDARRRRAMSGGPGVRGRADLDDVFAWKILGKIFQKRGDLEHAIASFEEALQRDAGHIPALEALAEISEGRAEADGSVAYLRRILALEPFNLRALAMMGMACVRAGRPEEGEAYLDAVSRFEAEDPVTLGASVLYLARHGELDAALRKVERYLSRAPRDARFADQLIALCDKAHAPEMIERVPRIRH
jgi:tetratricopeptide (TPR) repeat protein